MAMDASTLTRNLQPLVASGWAEIGPGADARSRASIVASPRPAAPSALEAQRDWKRAQLALNEQPRTARVAALHALLDDCLAALTEPSTKEISDA